MGKKEYLIFLALVFELVALVVSLVYVGSVLGTKVGNQGAGVVVGAMLAIIIWATHLIRAFKGKDL